MDNWFVLLNSNKIFNKKLFIFPYAGGGVSSFREWKNYFNDYALFVAQYPGRENRFNEKPITEFHSIIDNLYESVLKHISKDTIYYFFGHSFGAKVLYELLVRFKKNLINMPRGIIVSASRAPCYKEKNPIHCMDDYSFVEELKRFSSIPSEIVENFNIMKNFIPCLRADFTLDETYFNSDVLKIDVPILALMGRYDKELTLEELLKWKEYTSKDFFCEHIDGEHMFIHTHMQKVIFNIENFIGSFQ